VKLDIDYTNDSRWETFDKDHTQFNIPNVFVDTLIAYAPKIKHLKKINRAIETGTYMANTTEFFATHFDKVYTVEKNLTDEKHERYKTVRSKFPNIDFYHGTSDAALVDILKGESNTTFFFLLDAHDCEISPLKGELQSIKNFSKKRDHVIIIDDCVDLGSGNWPSKDEMISLLKDINPDYTIENTGIGRDIYIAY
jgi:hypothetical protein